MNQPYALAIHGGAGTIRQADMSPEKEAAYRQVLQNSIERGCRILKAGGTAIDAAEAAVVVMEDSDLFNAGKGSVFTAEGTHELEASIMCGQTLNAGAIGGATLIKNPVAVARTIMQQSDYVYLSGQGADQFAKEHGFPQVANTYFYSDFRYQQWQSVKNENRVTLDHSQVGQANAAGEKKFGTVGAVACDVHGNLAAATSTGGLVNKKYGRLGDSSVVGAGVYANNHTCAISCTGYGEFFLRGVVAYDISCLMEYKGLSLEEAARVVIHDKQVKLGGEGGIIGVDAQGNCSLVFNSEGMYRAHIQAGSPQPVIAIYG